MAAAEVMRMQGNNDRRTSPPQPPSPFRERGEDGNGPLAEMIAARLQAYDHDPLRTLTDAACDSLVSERSLRRYAKGSLPGVYNARLLMTWLGIDEHRMREAIEQQKREGA